jgi:predicted esterase
MSYQLEKWPKQTYSFSFPMRYKLWGPSGKGVVIALHGYQDHALSMMRRIGWWEKELPFQVLAVNAPFPVPIWTAEGFKEAYSWYFRDTERGFTIVSPEEMALRVFQLVQDVGLDGTPVMLFGFSQGGYMAPFVGRHLANLRGLIVLGSGYPPEPYKHLPRTRIFGLHGDKDERIPFDKSREAHAQLMKSGFTGEFITLPGLTHKVDPQAEPLVRRLAEEYLA